MIIRSLSQQNFTDFLKPRVHDAHKGLYGHVLIIGGDKGYSGAVRLAAEAALRVGAGLVSVATHVYHAANLNATRPEIMCHALDTEYTRYARKLLIDLLSKATIIILGPGLGQSPWSKKYYPFIMNYIIKNKKNLILDADGLNLLAKKIFYYSHWILTPHSAEAARLLQTTPEKIQEDRLGAIQQLQKKYGGVSILKGAGTLVLTNTAEDNLPMICDAGNPGMASGGMGDVLSGIIGGFAAQGLSLEAAAKLGVLIHAQAGDLAAKQGERGLLAMDLFPYLRQLVNNI